MPHPTTAQSSPARVSLAQRRLRAALLLLSLAWVPTSVALVVLGRLMWISIPLSVLTVVAVVVWLRTEVAADIARRSMRAGRGRRGASQPVLSSDDTQVIRPEAVHQAAAAAAAAHAADAAHAAGVPHADQVPHVGRPAAQDRSSVGRPGPAAAHRAPAGQALHHDQGVEAAHAGPTQPSRAEHPAAEAGSAAYEQVFDLEAVRSQPVPVQPPAEGTWQPVPVPRPTYAMKAKAEPRLTASGIPADVFDTPEFAEEADELDERALFARRAVPE